VPGNVSLVEQKWRKRMQSLVETTIRFHWHFSKRLYSVSTKTAGKGWRVVRDADGNQVFYGKLVLADAKFLVSEAGRARCIKQGVKNVHAHVEATLLNYEYPATGPYITGYPVRYNPFRSATFERQFAGEEWVPIKWASMLSAGVVDGKPDMLALGVK
jgi:hypothetical protein